MTNDKKDDQETKVQQTIDELEKYRDGMITDCLLRITALENLLMRSRIITDFEIKNEIIVISQSITKAVKDTLIPQLDKGEQVNLDQWAQDFSVVNKKPDKSSN